MRNRVTLLVMFAVIAASYLASPFVVLPVRFLSLSIENLHLSDNRLWLNFTVVIRNRGIWPLVLNEMHLHFRDQDGKPIVGFPSSLTLLPVQSIEIKGYGAYASDSYSVSSCCPGTEASVLTLNLYGYELPLSGVLSANHRNQFSIQATAVLPKR